MRKVLGKDVVVTESMVQSVVQDTELSKSAKMKALFDWGLSVSEISEQLGVRYNFVYNVITGYIASEKINVSANYRVTKKDQIIDLCRQGKSNREIADELGANYSYVYSTVRAYKESLVSRQETAATEMILDKPKTSSKPEKGFWKKLVQGFTTAMNG